MAEHTAFTCDAGCGSSVQIVAPATSERDLGWFTILTPRGMPTAQLCSAECLETYARRLVGPIPRLDA